MNHGPLDAASFVRERFGPGASLEHLAGDASLRRYFRVHPEGGAPRILMLQPGPFDETTDFFLRMAAFLARLGLRVPRVLEADGSRGAVLLEDLGSTSLQDHLLEAGVGPEERDALYEEAVDGILRLQGAGSAALAPDVPAYHYCLDPVRFGRELHFFAEHYVAGLLGDPLAGDRGAREALERSLASLARQAGLPARRVLCHRDYHARNLMLVGDTPGARLAIIDFQDARLGPPSYDLASLLEDAYVDVPEDRAARMKERYLEGVRRRPERAAFDREYAAVAAQRTLKAVGTFAGQAQLLGNRDYLGFIPRALSCARRALADVGDASDLAALLDGPLRYHGGEEL